MLDSSYTTTARANLSSWRSSLFIRTMVLTRETEKAERRQIQPSGHRRFDLFSPFVSCPDEPLKRIGGQGDGEMGEHRLTSNISNMLACDEHNALCRREMGLPIPAVSTRLCGIQSWQQRQL